ALGLARANRVDPGSDAIIARVQDDLFLVGSALADPDPDGPFHQAIGSEHAAALEALVDDLERGLPALTQFILPGGTIAAAQIHLARTICRRAERWVVKLAHQPGQHVGPDLIIYLNRLSDLLFVLARVVNRRAGVADVPWSGR